MISRDLNYFTCTLADAVHLKNQDTNGILPTFSTVLDLIDRQAEAVPHAPAVGFADFTSQQPASNHVFTFQQLRDLSLLAADEIGTHLQRADEKNQTCPGNIGLKSTSSIDFILTWLGLVRLGYSVLFLAPSLASEAIDNLCESLDISNILVPKENLARIAESTHACLTILNMPNLQHLTQAPSHRPNPPTTQPLISTVAYYCHTSGTSSNNPKPIPQYHTCVVGALCGLPENYDDDDDDHHHHHQPATFSTTPLYHGGLPDCFRAWRSGNMVWFFPEGCAPITAHTMVKAVAFAGGAGLERTVRYFSSVPYILQLLAAEAEGVQMLKDMDLVGVGGAALPASVGDDLVSGGVPLISRLGSAECGFLMSSHRPLATDFEWQYLRAPVIADPSLFVFEPLEDGLFELVVQPHWPCLAKTNRDDGSYATSDLFEPHPRSSGAWRYHSRADAQIAVANGKKFDPSPVEAEMLASVKTLQDVFIFGDGRDVPGAVLLPAAETSDMSEEEIVDSVWPVVQAINERSPSHARIPESMLVVVPLSSGQTVLEKSSKGTILRGRASERYAALIETAYTNHKNSSLAMSAVNRTVDSSRIAYLVRECFARVLGRNIDPDRDVFQQGIDSMACIQIRKSMQGAIFPQDEVTLPLNIIYDLGSINQLTSWLHRVKDQCHTMDPPASVDGQTTHQAMVDLVTKYSDFPPFNSLAAKTYRDKPPRRDVVALTGATGFLGAHILDCLQRDASVECVYCLVRAKSPQDAEQRVYDTLAKYKLSPRSSRIIKNAQDIPSQATEVVYVPCHFDYPDMGIPPFQHFTAQTPSVIIHAAWAVNFTLRLESFENHIAGTRQLMRMAAGWGARFALVSSTAAVASTDEEEEEEEEADETPEELSRNPGNASPMGYAQSKWVAEQLCAIAGDIYSQQDHRSTSPDEQPTPSSNKNSDDRAAPVMVLRVGQLCANESGVWNMAEAYPLMLSTAGVAGCLPVLAGETLDWLPVEKAAEAVVEASLMREYCYNEGDEESWSDGVDHCDRTYQPRPSVTTPVSHILNPLTHPSWTQMLHWLQQDTVHHPATPSFDIVSPSTWLHRLRDALKQPDKPAHRFQALLGVWEDAFSSQNGDALTERKKRKPRFETKRTLEQVLSMRSVRPVSRTRAVGTWRWIHGVGEEETS